MVKLITKKPNYIKTVKGGIAEINYIGSVLDRKYKSLFDVKPVNSKSPNINFYIFTLSDLSKF